MGSNRFQVFSAFLWLGCTSFGGPIAHLGYFREEFVGRRRWLDDKAYADLVALCNFLPGPASSQVGMAIGISRAGLSGGLAAWLGFTLPSALALLLFAYGFAALGTASTAHWLHGLKIAAVAVVAQAVWVMRGNLCPDALRASFALGAALLVLLVPAPWAPLAAIAAGAAAGAWLLRPADPGSSAEAGLYRVGKRAAAACLALFFILLAALPIARRIAPGPALELFDSFYRSGALVFGGGHVVLPLLRSEVVPPGWVSDDAFLAGYGAAQAVPGPLFTFAAYLGAVMSRPPNGIAGGLIALAAIFLPGFLLVAGALPLWNGLRRHRIAQRALAGVNAAVVGVLLAALYDPVWTSSIRSGSDLAIALAAFGMLMLWRLPPLAVVLFAAAAGALELAFTG
ncbi:MAG TPA: chromate efflux transporter [Burkholderiales bacterium]|nr:chromate efflux transporter [Burkholderiales bacterium]